ncbi:glycosyltransferase family 4 protein [Stygiolobus caldivivus]|uniref:Glycosyl transferase family 1 domain-containing protein n=1 Tax=Stygiolobus caldivivus TaxID=2824673 RepID=A0A8D5ZI78_9CREN|nr:glycosyltransferase family 4 protein [Stygiolobus caldivivus]BCU69047.1 hypothetical protein KN1_03440 [Stygiolobus caldivivus]
MRVHIISETPQRGTFATVLLLHKMLIEHGITSELYTTFKSDYKTLPEPPKSRIFGYEKMVNESNYAKKILDIISPDPKESIIHLANAMHGILPESKRRGVKSVINIQYWWPTCYFNSMDCGDCDCKTLSKLSRSIKQKKSGIRASLSYIEAFYARRKLEWIKKNLVEADILLAVSNIVKDILVQRGYPEDKIRIININGLHPDIPYVPYEPSEKDFIFAYLSYPDEGKGVFQLINAINIAARKNPNIKLKIPGGLEEPKVVELVDKLGIRDKVILTKRLPYEQYVKELPNILKDVDFIVVPTLVPDTWGRVVTESMLSGRPVIVTKGNGGLVEQVTDKVDGFHVNVYDLNEFAESLFKISQLDKETVRKMGLKAREDILLKYDNEKILSQIISLYRELLEK